MRSATAADYRAVAEAAGVGGADQRRRNRLRRALRAIRNRDYFSADERIEAERAVEALTAERVRA